MSWSLATNYFPSKYPRLPVLVHHFLGYLQAFLFGPVLAFELGYAGVALHDKISVRSIVLFVFGGVAQFEQEPRTRGANFM